MRVGIPDLEAVFHYPPSRSSVCGDLYTSARVVATDSENARPRAADCVTLGGANFPSLLPIKDDVPMPRVTYVSHDGNSTTLDVPLGTSVMQAIT
jgi:hypothetical protein